MKTKKHLCIIHRTLGNKPCPECKAISTADPKTSKPSRVVLGREPMKAVAAFFLICILGCADTQNLKNMSAREIQTLTNTPLYEEGTVERAWEDAFWDERLSYRTRNIIGEVLDEYQQGMITSREAFRRIRAIRKSSSNIGDKV